ncbi:hypothetical protein ABZ400_34380 [Streptomyces sp. NPDC005897]|uniref:hypothetical protein n=1 Tax=Streptomyces sp. NPDC005897 TaxID=3157081 RepID=UPI0033E38DFE
MPYSARIARVRDLGQPFQQAGNFLGQHRLMLADLVKGMRGRRGCVGRHDLPGKSRGVENSVILKGCAWLAAGTPMSWQAVMNRMSAEAA